MGQFADKCDNVALRVRLLLWGGFLPPPKKNKVRKKSWTYSWIASIRNNMI